MARLLRAVAAFACVVALGSCSDASDQAADDRNAVTPADSEPVETSTGEPTLLYVGRVVRAAPAGSAGCLDSVDADWKPDQDAKSAKLCGVQDDTDYWFSVDPATTFEATVTKAEASLPETSTTGDWVVDITLDDRSATHFGQLAAKLLEAPTPDAMALVVDGEVVSAPVPTPGIERLTTLQIGGDFTRDEAEELAASLSAG